MAHRAALLPTLAALLLNTAGCAASDQPATDPKPPVSAGQTEDSADGDAAGIPLADGIGRLTVTPEHTGGYERDAFEHWNTGVGPDDGCDTREEFLIAEAVKPPTRGEGCKLIGGQWLSYYDEATVTEPGRLDVDHMVALEEAWSSGAHAWDAEQREAYANDLEAPHPAPWSPSRPGPTAARASATSPSGFHPPPAPCAPT